MHDKGLAQVLNVRRRMAAVRAALMDPSPQDLIAIVPAVHGASSELSEVTSPSPGARAELVGLRRELIVCRTLMQAALNIYSEATQSGGGTYTAGGETEPPRVTSRIQVSA